MKETTIWMYAVSLGQSEKSSVYYYDNKEAAVGTQKYWEHHKHTYGGISILMHEPKAVKAYFVDGLGYFLERLSVESKGLTQATEERLATQKELQKSALAKLTEEEAKALGLRPLLPEK